MKLIGSCIALLALVTVADAQCRISYGYQQATYAAPTYAPTYQAAYVAPTYAVQVVASPVYLPVYTPAFGVGYGYGGANYGAFAASGYNASMGAGDDGSRALKERLDRAEARSDFLMQLLTGNKPQSEQPPRPGTAIPPKNDLPQAKAPGGVHPGVAIASQRCSACHDASTSKSKGDGLMLTTAGQKANIDAETFKRLCKVALKGSPVMPPVGHGEKLTDEQWTQVLDAYVQ